jgi:hypothetical protein
MIIAIGLGAGLVSALLFAVVITGSPLGMALSYVAPLPILIAALGWNHRSGLLAAAIGGAALGFLLRPTTGLAFAVGSGLPAWWIGYLALLGRAADPVAPSDAPRPNVAPTIEWYPIGRLLLWIALTAAAVILIGSLALGRGDPAAYRSLLTRAMETFLRSGEELGAGNPIPRTGMEGGRFVRVLIALVPAIAASVFCLFFMLNTWLAAKAVAISGRLPRPWPYLPATRMPASAVVLLFAGMAAAFAPDFVGIAGASLAGALAMAFALQGLALLHHLTQGKPGRTGLLIGTYLLTIFFGGTILPLMAVAGLVDSATPLRRTLTLRSGRLPD